MAEKKAELEKLFHLYASEVLIYAQYLTKNKAEAEDLMSEAFFQLSLQHTFPLEAKFWLFRVVKNKFFDEKRKQKRWGWHNMTDLDLVSLETPVTALMRNEAYQGLYTAIEALSQPYQEVIILFYFLNWSTAEISLFMQMKPGQVRTVLYRARKKIKAGIDNE